MMVIRKSGREPRGGGTVGRTGWSSKGLVANRLPIKRQSRVSFINFVRGRAATLNGDLCRCADLREYDYGLFFIKSYVEVLQNGLQLSPTADRQRGGRYLCAFGFTALRRSDVFFFAKACNSVDLNADDVGIWHDQGVFSAVLLFYDLFVRLFRRTVCGDLFFEAERNV